MSNDVKQAADSQEAKNRKPGASVLDMASKPMVLRRKLRHFYDQSASVAIAIGGVSVILAILLIFMYLFYEVLPLFESATLERVEEYQIENRSNSRSLHLAIEEQSEIGMRIGDQADALFFDVTDGATIAFIELSLPTGLVVVRPGVRIPGVIGSHAVVSQIDPQSVVGVNGVVSNCVILPGVDALQ